MKRALIALVRLYKKTLSPQTGVLRVLYYLPMLTLQPGRTGCRFERTCSSYAIDVLKTEPLPRALLRIARRIVRCHA